MKKALAMLLAVLLVLSPMIQASAAAPQERIEISASDLLNAAVENTDSPCVMAYPDPEMYGETNVPGNRLGLDFYFYNGKNSTVYQVAQVYKGTIDEIGDNDEPVMEVMDRIESFVNYGKTHWVWHTEADQATGDYTAIYAILDKESNILAATYCDLYISDKEIPLEKLELFVYELGMETDTVYTRAGQKMITLGVTRYPYHTTNRSSTKFETGSLVSVEEGTFSHGTALSLPSEPGTYTVSAYVKSGEEKIEASLDIHITEDTSKLVSFDSDGLERLCFDEEHSIGVTTPDGFGVGDCLFQTRNPLFISAHLGEDCIVLSSLYKTRSELNLVVACGNSYDIINLRFGDHDYETSVEKEPNCMEEGIQVNQCVYCGDREETVLPKSPHDFGEAGMVVVQEPTATKCGSLEGQCVVCQQSVKEEIPQIFSDTSSSRYYSDAVDYCYANGMMNGVEEHRFAPDETMTRAMLVTVLYRYAGEPEVSIPNPFEDVDGGRYYTKAVLWAYENGVVNGVTDDTFQPDATCTREQFVTILYRFAKANGLDNGGRADLSGYTDSASVHNYAREAFSWAVANGIIKGMTADTLVPGGSASRAQAATMLYRYIQHMESLQSPEEPEIPEAPEMP